MILEEMRNPKYMEYHLFFTNEIQAKAIEAFAHGDPNDRIKTLQ